jgi:hypothetical protein
VSATVTYAVARLETGSRRWAVLRNGEVLVAFRQQSTAELEARTYRSYLEIMGCESDRVRRHLTSVRIKPWGLS